MGWEHPVGKAGGDKEEREHEDAGRPGGGRGWVCHGRTGAHTQHLREGAEEGGG